jgi:hypothetical protein
MIAEFYSQFRSAMRPFFYLAYRLPYDGVEIGVKTFGGGFNSCSKSDGTRPQFQSLLYG